jgi:hypothetical protein
MTGIVTGIVTGTVFRIAAWIVSPDPSHETVEMMGATGTGIVMGAWSPATTAAIVVPTGTGTGAGIWIGTGSRTASAIAIVLASALNRGTIATRAGIGRVIAIGTGYPSESESGSGTGAATIVLTAAAVAVAGGIVITGDTGIMAGAEEAEVPAEGVGSVVRRRSRKSMRSRSSTRATLRFPRRVLVSCVRRRPILHRSRATCS